MPPKTATHRGGERLYSLAVILPIKLLLGNADNRYELSAAAMRRAHHLTIIGEDEEVEANRGKVVSTAIKQILTKKVKYEIER